MQIIVIERRQHPRAGIFGEIENVTYGVLRNYGITRQASQSLEDQPDEAA